jgi:hypothetical protein
LAVLTIPTIASRQDADAAVRLVLEDLGHFATRRKARVGDDVLLVLDEFSAIQGGTDQAIHLAERLRDVGVPVIFGAHPPKASATSASSGGCSTPSVAGWSCTRPPTPTPSSSSPARSACPSRPGSSTPGAPPAKPAFT